MMKDSIADAKEINAYMLMDSNDYSGGGGTGGWLESLNYFITGFTHVASSVNT